ncbi:MAG: hypothetical protein GX045_04950 [Clostridiaceae bacterium]|jgi:hypothetical protein|nr:hypothetical protein [Clostridiaceae bacterium]
MLKDLAWNMFKSTGNIEYYIQYRNVKNNKPDFSIEAGEENIVDGEGCLISKQKESLPGK